MQINLDTLFEMYLIVIINLYYDLLFKLIPYLTCRLSIKYKSIFIFVKNLSMK